MRISGKGRIVPQGELAEIFGCTSATVRGWKRAGCPVEQEGGSGRPSLFNTALVIRWREALAASATADVDMAEGRRRKVVAEAKLRELELEAATGRLLPREDVHFAVTAAFTRVRSKLLALPSKVAPLVMGLKSPASIHEKLRVAINEALAELASTVIAGGPVENGSKPAVTAVKPEKE